MLGVSCGTIMGANIALPFVACLFHDVNTMTGLFIHMMPPLVMHTFMWNSSDIRAAWPRVFHLTHMDSIQFFPKSGPFVVPSSVSSVVFGICSIAGCSADCLPGILIKTLRAGLG